MNRRSTLAWLISGISALAALGGVLKIAFAVPEATAVAAADVLLLALAMGWILRSITHALLRYFFPIDRPGVPRYRLMGLSVLNAAFAILWLSAAVMLLEHPDPVQSGIAIVVTTCLAFLFSLFTHRAAEAAGLERGSELIRDWLRDPLEPAANTVIGWPLVKLLDWPSSPKHLSPYVGGSLAMLLVALLLVVPPAMNSIGSPGNDEGPGGNATRAPKIAPISPAPPCSQAFSVRA